MRRGVGTAMNLCILFRRLKERFRDFDRLRKGARHLEQELSIGNGSIRCLRGSILHPDWCPMRIFYNAQRQNTFLATAPLQCGPCVFMMLAVI